MSRRSIMPLEFWKLYMLFTLHWLCGTIFFHQVDTKTGTKHLKVLKHGDTRWVSKYKSLYSFKTHLKSIVQTLKACANSQKSKEAAEAKGLLLKLTSIEEIFVLVALGKILACVNILSRQLQLPVIDVMKCIRIVEATTEKLKKFRTDGKFEELYKESQDFFQNYVADGFPKQS